MIVLWTISEIVRLLLPLPMVGYMTSHLCLALLWACNDRSSLCSSAFCSGFATSNSTALNTRQHCSMCLICCSSRSIEVYHCTNAGKHLCMLMYNYTGYCMHVLPLQQSSYLVRQVSHSLCKAYTLHASIRIHCIWCLDPQPIV